MLTDVMKPYSSAGQLLQDSNPTYSFESEDVQTGMDGFDPLQASTRLPYSRTFFPLGFPAHIRSNDPSVIEAASLSWEPDSQRFYEPPIQLRFIVSDDPTPGCPPVPAFRAQGNLLTVVADANNYGSCDLATGFGFAQVTPAALQSAEFFRYHFLEGMAYTLLDTRHLTTIHAACAAYRDRGVLLVGESGAGKSSFAYACAQRGWTYVCDDASSLVTRRNDRRVIGNSRSIRFRPSVTSLFPELGGHVRDRNGKPTLELRTEHLPRVKPGYECEINSVIFLNRKKADFSFGHLAPVSRLECFHRLSQNPWPVELTIHKDRNAAIQRLCDAPAFELTYRSFDPAIDALEHLLASSDAT